MAWNWGVSAGSDRLAAIMEMTQTGVVGREALVTRMEGWLYEGH